LRKETPDKIANINDVSEGLENRIFNAAKEQSALDELIGAVKTKRYTYARLRRIMLHSYLGICREDLVLPQYLKILDFNSRGQEILNNIKKATKLPLVKNFAQLKKLGDEKAIQMWERELVFDSLYEFCRG
jgi:predicted nucleotidyltransferase